MIASASSRILRAAAPPVLRSAPARHVTYHTRAVAHLSTHTSSSSSSSSSSSTSTSSLPLHLLLGSSAITLACTSFTRYSYCDSSINTTTATIPSDVSINTTDNHLLEPVSGVTFAATIPSPSLSFTFVASSCRMMRQLVQVYSIALYLPSSSSSSSVDTLFATSFASFPASQAAGLWDAVSDPRTDKTFRLVVARQVAGSHMGAGFQRALVSRAQAYAARHGGLTPGVVKKNVRTLCDAFSKVGTMKVGSVADLVVSEGLVTLVIDGRTVCAVKDDALAWAVADMYVGDDAVTPDFRTHVVSGLQRRMKEKETVNVS